MSVRCERVRSSRKAMEGAALQALVKRACKRERDFHSRRSSGRAARLGAPMSLLPICDTEASDGEAACSRRQMLQANLHSTEHIGRRTRRHRLTLSGWSFNELRRAMFFPCPQLLNLQYSMVNAGGFKLGSSRNIKAPSLPSRMISADAANKLKETRTRPLGTLGYTQARPLLPKPPPK